MNNVDINFVQKNVSDDVVTMGSFGFREQSVAEKGREPSLWKLVKNLLIRFIQNRNNENEHFISLSNHHNQQNLNQNAVIIYLN